MRFSVILLLLVSAALAGCAATGRRNSPTGDREFEAVTKTAAEQARTGTVPSPRSEPAAVNPDFPGGQQMAIEALQEFDLDRDVPTDATLVTALFPAGARATILAGLRRDSTRYRETGRYVTDNGVTLRVGVRLYLGGGK